MLRQKHLSCCNVKIGKSLVIGREGLYEQSPSCIGYTTSNQQIGSHQIKQLLHSEKQPIVKELAEKGSILQRTNELE